MAVRKTIEIEAKLDDAIKSIDGLNDQMEELVEKQKESNVQAKAQTKQLGILGKAAKGLRTAFRGVGLALKALGVGLVLEAFNLLKEIFSENQRVLDFFNTSFNVLSLAFNDFFNFINDNVGTVAEYFKELFSDPMGKVKQFGAILQGYFVNAFKQVLNAIEAFGGAIKALFSGKWKEAIELAKEGARELVDAYVGVEDGGVEVLTNGVKKLTKGIVEYTKSTIEAAESITELNKSARIAEAINRGLIEQYDRQAEKLRQVRDDDLNTLAERVKANEELGKVLEMQEKAMLANADAVIAAAQAEYDRNSNVENYIALLEAQNEREAILAQVEGFRSEQLSNQNALRREAIELQNSETEATQERSLAQKEFDAEMLDSELARLEMMRQIAIEEGEIQAEILRNKRNSYAEGTQYWVDANNELLAFQQENANAQIKIEREVAEAKMATVMTAIGQAAQLAGEGTAFGKALAVAQAIIDTYAGATVAFKQTGIFGGIAGAGIIAAGLANVRRILQTDVPSSPFGGGGYGGGGSVPSGVTPAQPNISFNTLQGVGNQITDAIQGQNNRPVQAYVTQQSIDNGNQLKRKIVGQASFG